MCCFICGCEFCWLCLHEVRGTHYLRWATHITTCFLSSFMFSKQKLWDASGRFISHDSNPSANLPINRTNIDKLGCIYSKQWDPFLDILVRNFQIEERLSEVLFSSLHKVFFRELCLKNHLIANTFSSGILFWKLSNFPLKLHTITVGILSFFIQRSIHFDRYLFHQHFNACLV